MCSRLAFFVQKPSTVLSLSCKCNLSTIFPLTPVHYWRVVLLSQPFLIVFYGNPIGAAGLLNPDLGLKWNPVSRHCITIRPLHNQWKLSQIEKIVCYLLRVNWKSPKTGNWGRRSEIGVRSEKSYNWPETNTRNKGIYSIQYRNVLTTADWPLKEKNLPFTLMIVPLLFQQHCLHLDLWILSFFVLSPEL